MKCGFLANNCCALAPRLPLTRAKPPVQGLIPSFARNWTVCFKKQTNPNFGSNYSVVIVTFVA